MNQSGSRRFLPCASALLCLALMLNTACSGPLRETPPRRPNFIVFFTDELQHSDLGAYGGRIPTPEFDWLAREGMRFDRAYSAASMCTPSRYALLTGQFPGRCTSAGFMQGNPVSEPYSIAWNTWLPAGAETLPRVLSRHGYFTGMVGKWHVGEVPDGLAMPGFGPGEDPRDPEVQQRLALQQQIHRRLVCEYGGFDFASSVVWANYDNHPLPALQHHNFPWLSKGAMAFLDSASRQDKPFFLYFTPTAIHGPNHVEDLDRDVRFTPGGFDGDLVRYMPDTARIRREIRDIPASAAHRWVGMAQMDYQLYLIREKLLELGIDDNTVILFMSDHNIEPGKATSYEKGIHIPMILHWPGRTTGSVNHALVQTVDVFPGILQAAGIPMPEGHIADGISFLPLLENPDRSLRQYLFAENGYTRSVTDGRYKYIALRYPESLISAMESGTLRHVPSYVKAWPQAHSAIAMQSYPHYFDQDQLYDLQSDPYELHNLADDTSYHSVMAELRSALEGHLGTFGHPFPLAPIPFLQSDEYRELCRINLQYDLGNIPWLGRDHGSLSWPPEAP
jgi:arylsulfatase A-like enzyme